MKKRSIALLLSIVMLISSLALNSCSPILCIFGHSDKDSNFICDVCGTSLLSEEELEKQDPAEDSEEEKAPEDSETPAEPEKPVDPKDCAHEYEVVDKKRPLVFKSGKATYKCPICKDSYSEKLPEASSIKILAIGNSFSVDATTYLWNICRAAGIDDVVVAYAQVGGSSLDNHASYISKGSAHYEYVKYKTDSMGEVQTNVKLDLALEDEEWDFITVQQLSSAAGKPDTYGNLETIVSYVSEKCPEADIYWQMTWAYKEGITKAGYEYYNNDQLTMYNAIVSTVQSQVLTNPKIKGVIPAGTTLQNIRTSAFGDNVTRDGSHAGYGVGRFAVAMTWFVVFTGGSPDMVKWNTTDYQLEVKHFRSIINEAVENAIKKPYQITQSSYVN